MEKRIKREDHSPPGNLYANSTAEVDLVKMSENLSFLKKKAGVNRAIAVVKANAYGHGAVPVANRLEPEIETFAVASVDEAVELRKSGIQKPVLVFGMPDSETAQVYRQYNLEATIGALNHFDLLPDSVNYQVNMDTGMRRLGIFPEQVEQLSWKMKEHKKRGLNCRGIYSHYPMADEPGSVAVINQNEQFHRLCDSFAPDIPLHMSNTAAVVHYSKQVNHFDKIRIGIGLSGYTSGRLQSEALQPAMEWKTRAVSVRKISKGNAVSYTGSWKAPADGFLVTLPVGYADGVPKVLTNRLLVAIDQEMYPVVGNITMDYCMVFSGNRKIEEGSEVTLMGGNGWRANKWAESAGSITHEILCRITGRVKREYIS